MTDAIGMMGREGAVKAVRSEVRTVVEDGGLEV